MSAHTFYTSTAEPEYIEQHRQTTQSFCSHHLAAKTKVVLITSGGTTVPLEKNTVRFLDNFSAGTRGAASAECFLEAGYAVIFLHRAHSLLPFARHFHSQSIFSYFAHNEGSASLTLLPSFQTAFLENMAKSAQAIQQNRLLLLPFTSVKDYLFMLRMCATQLHALGSSAVLYLAAAVSDFYVPDGQQVEHKIQSTEEPLHLTLPPVPKVLTLLSEWVPTAYVITFKLETLPTLLESKALGALHKYSHQMVLANLLTTRKHHIAVYTQGRPDPLPLTLTEDESAAGTEIEAKIINHVVSCHQSFIVS